MEVSRHTFRFAANLIIKMMLLLFNVFFEMPIFSFSFFFFEIAFKDYKTSMVRISNYLPKRILSSPVEAEAEYVAVVIIKRPLGTWEPHR